MAKKKLSFVGDFKVEVDKNNNLVVKYPNGITYQVKLENKK